MLCFCFCSEVILIDRYVLTKGDLMSLKPRAKLDNMVKPFSLLHFII